MANIDPTDRFSFYEQNHCWQYDIRLSNLNSDITESNLTNEEIEKLTIDDFTFTAYNRERDDEQKRESKDVFIKVKQFIERHEWLGKMSLYPSHIFTAEYKGILAGVIVMDMPNTFSKLLGETTRKMERLVSRGACISWSPKGLASSLLMWSVRWMVQNTRYRIFGAYSDPEARELGTIYQACNWIYIGQNSGTSKMYKKDGRWFSDRYFRSRSAYKRYAKEMGIKWEESWQKNDRIIWDNVPDDIEKTLKIAAKKAMEVLESRTTMPKHKYIYILGRSKKETKALKAKFAELNPQMVNLPYPKERGK